MGSSDSVDRRFIVLQSHLQNFFKNYSLQFGDDVNNLHSFKRFELFPSTATIFLTVIVKSKALQADCRRSNYISQKVVSAILSHKWLFFYVKRSLLLFARRLSVFYAPKHGWKSTNCRKSSGFSRSMLETQQLLKRAFMHLSLRNETRGSVL